MRRVSINCKGEGIDFALAYIAQLKRCANLTFISDKLTIDTKMEDVEIRLINERNDINVTQYATIDELEPKVIEILKGCEDNEIELDYPVHILRECCEGEYYDNVIKVSYDDFLCFETAYSDIYKDSLSSDELTEIYQNIIDQTENG